MIVDIASKILFKSPFVVLPDDAVNTKLPSSEELLWSHFHLYSHRLKDFLLICNIIPISLELKYVTQLFWI